MSSSPCRRRNWPENFPAPLNCTARPIRNWIRCLSWPRAPTARRCWMVPNSPPAFGWRARGGMPVAKTISSKKRSASPGNKMDFGIAFALGLLGSLHCAAMCGPLMLALPVPPGGPARFITGRILYQAGRVATYCLLGVVAGLAGKSIFLGGMQRWLSIALGVAILGGFLVSKKVSLSAPAVRLVARLKAAMSLQLQRRGFRSLVLLGMLNGLLPCGLVYVAMAGALSRSTVLDGVFYMAAFGLGTLPTMLGTVS